MGVDDIQVQNENGRRGGPVLSRRQGLLGLAGAGALWSLSACGGDGDGGDGGGGSTDPIIVWGGEPQNPLVPTNSNETNGGKIINAVFAGLVSYQADGTPQNEAAESIETTDAQNFTIKLKAGQTFSDGTPVTAATFVDAWNYGALATNAQKAQSFFAPIAGFDAVSADPPTAETLSGLVVVDDTTFTVELAAPESDFPLRLGYSAYFPIPTSAYDDIAAFGENPVGNGPYKLESEGAWRHDQGINLVVNDSYSGPRTPQNSGVNIIFFADLDAAYSALQSGELDVLDTLPDSALTTFQQTLGSGAVNQPAAIFQAFTIPHNLAHFDGEEGRLRRQAVAYAIDRASICKVVFNDTRVPAKDFSSTVVPGWTEDVPGNEVCTFDAAKAKELWAQAEAISPFTGTLEIGYNTDGGHQTWVDAVTAGLRQTLGMQAEGKAYPTFGPLLDDIDAQKAADSYTMAFRSGWQADYPSMYNFLYERFQSGTESNSGNYDNPEFDQALLDAAGQPDQEDAVAVLVQAQSLLFADLPAIPLWYQNSAGGFADTVTDVKFGWDSVPLYPAIKKS